VEASKQTTETRETEIKKFCWGAYKELDLHPFHDQKKWQKPNPSQGQTKIKFGFLYFR